MVFSWIAISTNKKYVGMGTFMIKNRDSINEDIERNDLPQGEKNSKKFTDFIGNIIFKLSKGENYSKKLNAWC